jgi:hypothetical protein
MLVYEQQQSKFKSISRKAKESASSHDSTLVHDRTETSIYSRDSQKL